MKQIVLVIAAMACLIFQMVCVSSCKTSEDEENIKEEPLVPLTSGIYPSTGSAYIFDKNTDQVNIYEANGNTWVRFLLIPTLTMYEIGPIPSDVAVGTTVVTSVSTYVNGVKTESRDNCNLTVRSLAAEIMNLVSDDGTRYVFRF